MGRGVLPVLLPPAYGVGEKKHGFRPFVCLKKETRQNMNYPLTNTEDMEVEHQKWSRQEDYCPLQTGGELHFHVSESECKTCQVVHESTNGQADWHRHQGHKHEATLTCKVARVSLIISHEPMQLQARYRLNGTLPRRA